MNRFAVNLSTIFTEVPFLERFKKARECGFSFAECQFPYEYGIDEIVRELEEQKLTLLLINLPPGDWDNGERGIAIFPDRTEEFKASVEKGIAYAQGLNISLIHCMAGVMSADIHKDEAKETFMKNIRYAAEKMAVHNMTLLIEPINPFDMPGYFLSDIDEAVSLITELNLPNVKLQYDFYHMQRIQGNLLTTFEKYKNVIGHVQIADVPGRHQPGTGEINYRNVFQFLEKNSYNGFIGLEYIPSGKSENSFNWLREG